MADTQGLLEAAPMAMMVVDQTMRLVMTNTAARELLGPAAVGKPFVTLLRHPLINDAVEKVLNAEEPSRRSFPARLTVPGRALSVQVTVSSVAMVSDPGQGGVAIAIEDLTALESAEAMRRDFVANVSHELRTPLTALSGFIETLRGAARNDEAARDRFLTIMEGEAGRMNRLIADLLSLTRVETEERRRPSQDVDLTALLTHVVATLSCAAEASGGVIDFMPCPEPVVVAGDSDQLVQVFHNLIENGVKYGAVGGRVSMTVEPVQHEPVLRGPAWAVTVADEGDGIDARHLPRLTERFYRVDSHRAREKGGTGLGLAIVKHIINRHRGRLRIESEKGQGSRFTVILPAKPV